MYFFWVFRTFAQDPDTALINHLVRNNLEIEHHTYLFDRFSKDSQNEMLLQYRSRFYLLTQNDSLFIEQYIRNKSYGLRDTCLIKLATAQYLNPLHFGHKLWFEELNTSEVMVYSSAEYYTFRKAWYSEDTVMTDLPLAIQDSYIAYLKYRDRKPWRAAIYSAIVPGSGKLYAGHKKAFLPNFLTHVAVGFQAGEAISKHGLRSAISIVNLSIFAFYYASNIYGSARAVKTKQKEYRNQFLIEASEYYDSKCNCYLY